MGISVSGRWRKLLCNMRGLELHCNIFRIARQLSIFERDMLPLRRSHTHPESALPWRELHALLWRSQRLKHAVVLMGAGWQPGLFLRKLQTAGFLDESGGVTPSCLESGALEPTINKLLTHCERWETLMLIVHDLGHVFDHINVATAVHRIAKLSRRQHVRPCSLSCYGCSR